MFGRLLLTAGVAVVMSHAFCEDLVLAERGQTPCHSIVTCRNGGPSCAYAAEELRDYVRRMTDVVLPIGAEDAKPMMNVIYLKVVSDPALGDDGFELKEKDGNLLVRGGVRGVLYGVYELLETYGGCGWYASWRTVVPKRETFSVPKNLADRQVPSFLLREPSWMDVRRHVDFAVRLRMNGAGSNPEAKHGGAAYRFVKGLSRSHTFDKFLPAEKYFEKHPEWFAEIGGQRRGNGDRTQICLSNPEALEESVKNLTAMIEADPYGARVVGVSQNDNHANCTCAKCAAIDAEEASPCGTLMRFVNSVAERLEKRFPDIMVETLIYMYSRKPPKLTRPRHNVMPCFCTYEAEFAHPLTESEYCENVAIVKDLREWGKRTDNLFVWDYTSNWRFFQQPMATVYSLRPNFRFFLENGAKYLYCEGGAYHADFANLRGWLIAKLSWNANADVNALLDRFFNGCYGPAAPHARAVFDRLHGIFRVKKEAVQTIWHRDLRHVITDADLDGMLAEWDKALAVARATGDDELIYSVRAAAFPYVATKLNRAAEDTKFVWATRDTSAYSQPQDAPRLYDRAMAFWDEAHRRKHDIRTGDGSKTACTLAGWKRILEFHRPDVSSYRAGVGDFRVLGTAPVVEDGTALAGKAYRIPPSAPGEALALRMGNVATDRGVPYRVRVHARVERVPDGKGEALRVRAFHGVTGDQPFDKAFGADALDDRWAWYDIGTFTPDDPYDLFVAGGRYDRGGGPKAVKALYVDALEFVPEGK